MTYLWQEARGSKFYFVQTDNREISRKINRRKGFMLSANAVNKNLWIYSCKFTRPDIAKKVVSSITCKTPIIDSEGLISYD